MRSLVAVLPAAGDAELALHYAGRAGQLEDDPRLIGYIVACQTLGAALFGAARHVSLEVQDEAVAAEEAWGQDAAATVAELRLAEAGLMFATDPRAAIPAMERAVALADGWAGPLRSLLRCPISQALVGGR